jgi:hypothetical protein
MKRLSVAVSLALLIWACGACSRSPSPASPSAARVTYTLSGHVSEVTPTGQAAVVGARVATGPLFGTTDENGFYSISGLYAVSSSITVSKAGYETDTRTLTITGDMQFDIRVMRKAVYTVSGVVSEATPTGLTPVEGVRIEEISCPDFDGCPSTLLRVTTTDRSGFYSISGVSSGKNNYLWATKAGYDDSAPESPPCEGGCHTVTVNGDTRFDVQLVRR